MSGNPITFSGQHLLNLILGLINCSINIFLMQNAIRIYFGL